MAKKCRAKKSPFVCEDQSTIFLPYLCSKVAACVQSDGALWCEQELDVRRQRGGVDREFHVEAAEPFQEREFVIRRDGVFIADKFVGPAGR